MSVVNPFSDKKIALNGAAFKKTLELLQTITAPYFLRQLNLRGPLTKDIIYCLHIGDHGKYSNPSYKNVEDLAVFLFFEKNSGFTSFLPLSVEVIIFSYSNSFVDFFSTFRVRAMQVIPPFIFDKPFFEEKCSSLKIIMKSHFTELSKSRLNFIPSPLELAQMVYRQGRSGRLRITHPRRAMDLGTIHFRDREFSISFDDTHEDTDVKRNCDETELTPTIKKSVSEKKKITTRTDVCTSYSF